MYCKNCGQPIDDNAKFCGSCGNPVQEAPRQNYTAPKPFETNSIDGRNNPQYQQSTFRGVQKSVGTSGSIGFGRSNKKKSGFFGKLIKLAVLAAVVIAVIIIVPLFFGGPISNVESGTGVDLVLQEITGKTSTFATSDPEIYLLFEHSDLAIGSEVEINLFYADEEYSMDAYIFDVDVDEGLGYVAFPRPGGAWQVGEYTVEFVQDGELLTTYVFTVE